MIRFQCAHCYQKLHIEDDGIGKQVTCAKCGRGSIAPAPLERIVVTCINCAKKIRVSGTHAGRKGKCPQCEVTVTIPCPIGTPVDMVEKNARSGIPVSQVIDVVLLVVLVCVIGTGLLMIRYGDPMETLRRIPYRSHGPATEN